MPRLTADFCIACGEQPCVCRRARRDRRVLVPSTTRPALLTAIHAASVMTPVELTAIFSLYRGGLLDERQLEELGVLDASLARRRAIQACEAWRLRASSASD